MYCIIGTEEQVYQMQSILDACEALDLRPAWLKLGQPEIRPVLVGKGDSYRAIPPHLLTGLEMRFNLSSRELHEVPGMVVHDVKPSQESARRVVGTARFSPAMA